MNCLQTKHLIPKQSIVKLEIEIEKLNRKARKLGVKEVEYKIVGDEIIERDKLQVPCYLVEITQMEEIKVSGYSLVAKLEKNKEESFIISSFDENIPEEIKQKRICQHCNVNRRRNTYYILKNENNEYIMVGKSCLKDFLGNKSAEQIATYIENIQSMIDDMIYDDEKPYYFNLGESYYQITQILQLAIYSIKKRGFKPSSSYGYSTKDHVGDMILRLHKDFREEFNEAIETIPMEEVQEVIDTINGVEETSDFFNNLKTLIKDESVRFRMFGYVVAMPSVVDKLKGIVAEPKKEKKESNYIGEIGEKIETTLFYRRQTAFNTQYGAMYMFFFEDEDDNIVVWKTSKYVEFDEETTYKVRGTVKEHSEYRDKKQTFIIRPKFEGK